MLNYSILTKPVHGILSGKAPNLVYKPNLNYNGKDSFMFKVDDGHTIGNTSNNIGKVNLTISQVNDPPVAINGSKVSTYQDKPVNLTLAGKDLDNDNIDIIS